MEIVEDGIIMFSQINIENIIRRYQNTIFRIAFTYCRNKSDAEDIAQEVFLRYLKYNKDFETEEHLKAWLIRVAVNLSKDLLRSSWMSKTDSISKHENLFAEDQEKSEIYYAIMSLSEKYRSVIFLYYYEDYDVKEIAEILDRSETAVQTQLRRARAILKQKLNEWWKND